MSVASGDGVATIRAVQMIDCILHWLERFKPLWDFLTAIGTIGLAGVTVGLATRAEWAARREQIRRFKELQALMPNLFRQMATHLRSVDDKSTREIVTLRSQTGIFDFGGKRRFAYSEEDYPNLRNQIDMLRDAGYLEDIKINDDSVSIYRMREPFVRLLKERA
jgi:hypothetical protein